jgi:ABC-type branched-subunit amino acid transport system substrate-binding protein
VKKHSSKRLTYLLCLLTLFPISACRPNTLTTNIPIAGLWNVTVQNGQPDWTTASVLAQEEHSGFELANQTTGFKEFDFSEGNRQDDVQVAVRKMVEGQTDSPKVDPVLALVGATSDEGTARATALSNFFDLPMVVPSASGDNLLPANNLWAFQLSVPNSAYANYILGSVLTSQSLGSGQVSTPEPTPGSTTTPTMSIAILYEQNTYGETAAVATATAAMQQGFEIKFYDKFPAENPAPDVLRKQINQVIDQDAQVIFLISSAPTAAQSIVQIFNSLLDPLAMPVLVGMAGGFTSQVFLDSAQSKDVFILRQQMDAADCPTEIQSLYAAQNYAAVQLMSYAVGEAPNLAADKTKLSLKNSDGLSAYREAVRDALKAANLKLPCLGQVAFDNAGQNKFVNIEIITTSNGTVHTVPADEFITAVEKKLGLGSSQ